MTRTIQINFQTKTPSSYDLGYIGEHNATEITFIPSDELKNDPRTAAYYLAFDTGGHIIPSEVKRINEPFSVTLQQQLTKNHCMSIQLIAVDTEENFIGKTEFLRGFHFKASAKEFNTEPIEDDDVLLAEIHANTAARHTHSNKALLDTYSQTENDLADAVNKKHTHSNKDFLDTLNQETLDEKVDKIPGKGLSTNDFTDAKKQKLEAMNVFFGNCLTAAGTTKKAIFTDSQFELREGVTLVVYFFDGCSVAIPVFNVNSTGEHSAYRNYDSTSELAISRISAGGIGVFVYYNGKWYQPNLFNASGTNYGVVSLSDSTNSASDATRGIAATPKAVKTVADIANAKQDPIADLATIRSGAALGATATQPSDLEAEVTAREDGDTELQNQINNKVDKVTGKGLSSEDYTTSEKSKLEGISANAKNVSVSASGTATDEVGYITVDGVEKKLAGGSKTTIVETIDDAPANPQIGDRITVLQDGSTDSVPMSAVIGLSDALNGKQNLLPSGTNNGDILLWDSSQNKYVSKPKWQMIYQPVEYIEATGTQWINTGLKGADGVDIDFEIIEDVHTIVGSAVFSSREEHKSVLYGIDNYTWNGFYIGRFSQSPDISKILESYQLLSRHQLRFGTAFENKIYIDGEYYSDHSSVMQYSSPTSVMCLFKNASTEVDKAKARIYSARFYIGSTLARDLIPVRNVSDGSIGMYDKTEGKFYGNSGSGTFLKGADI